jgi:hypothetical protein
MKLSSDFGEDFPLAVEVIEAKTRHAEAKFRGCIAIGVLVFAGVALGVAAFVGLRDGSFNELNGVWMPAAPLVGAVVFHYLGRKNE